MNAKTRHHRTYDEGGICKRCQFNKPHSICELFQTSRAHLQTAARFPRPPDPVSVTRRCDSKSFLISSISFSRPINVVSCSGRLFRNESSVFNGGKVASKPATLS